MFTIPPPPHRGKQDFRETNKNKQIISLPLSDRLSLTVIFSPSYLIFFTYPKSVRMNTMNTNLLCVFALRG